MVDTTELKTVDIKDVWQALGFELGRGNANARCFSPAHAKGDRNPSLGFDRKTNRFKCFACGVSGDTIELVEQVNGIDFKEATRWLAERFNISISSQLTTNQVTDKYIRRGNAPTKRPRSYTPEPIRNPDCIYQLPDHIEVYKAFFDNANEPNNEPNNELREWWLARGLSEELLDMVQWRTITRETWRKTAELFSPKKLEEAGLLTLRNGELKPIFYRHTVVVPFFDGDTLIYLRARTLDKSVKAKYLAPRGTSPPIYNYQALTTYDGTQPLFITESETDALALTEMGETALALVGGQKHPESLVVRELTEGVITCFDRNMVINIATDRDDTGNHFFESIAKSLYLAGVPSKNIIRWQCDHIEHKDVAECLQAQRTERPNGYTDKKMNKKLELEVINND